MANLMRIKSEYWKLRTRGFRSLDNTLRGLGVQGAEYWARVVMDRETTRAIEALGPARLKVLEISGVDWKSRCKFREYKSISFPEFDICNSRLDEQFDLVIAEQVWEHLQFPFRAARNVHGMLALGGYFLVTTPFLLKVHHVPVDCSRWTELGLRNMLAESGFPLENISTGSWGNRACLTANLNRWVPYRPWLHSLRNEPDFPVHVWALAQKTSVN